MPIFNQLNRAAVQRGLQFLVIGGHAVMGHGFLRATQDVDLLVSKEDRDRWIQLAQDLDYRLFHDGGSFLQLSPAAGSGWELDLMLVPQPTFQKMVADAKSADLEGTAVLIPSLEHLFALKIHALKHGRGLRLLKDMNDVVELVLANGVDVRSDFFRGLFEKHGDLDLYERVLKACSES